MVAQSGHNTKLKIHEPTLRLLSILEVQEKLAKSCKNRINNLYALAETIWTNLDKLNNFITSKNCEFSNSFVTYSKKNLE